MKPILPSLKRWAHTLILAYAAASFGLASACAQSGLDDDWWDDAIGNPGLNSVAYGVAVHGNLVYVSGAFTRAGNVDAKGVACWNGTNWSAVGGGVSVGVWDPTLVAVNNGIVYVAGRFFTAYQTDGTSVSVSNIAAWDGTNWSTMRGGVDGPVNALTASGGYLYVGGAFTNAGGVASRGIAQWDGTNWSTVGGGLNMSITAMASHGARIYVAGATDSGSFYPGARWDGANWSWLNFFSAPGRVNALAAIGEDDVLVGGNFGVDPINRPVNGLARWTTQGFDDRTGENPAGSIIYAIVANNAFAFVGGNQQVRKSKVFCSDTWAMQTLGGGIQSARGLALTEDSLYVAGAFEYAGVKPSKNIARWKAPTLPTVTVWNPSATPAPGSTNFVQFDVSVCRVTEPAVTLHYSTSNATAVAGIDYMPVSGTLIFTNGGPLSQFVSVPVYGSPFYHPSRQFWLRLSTTNLLVASWLADICTIYGRLPSPLISIDDAQLVEGDTGTNLLTFTISLSAPIADPLTVPLQFQNNTAVANIDYLPYPTNVVVPSGSVSQSFSVPILANSFKEVDKRFSIRLATTTPDLSTNKGIGIGTILNDDTVPGLAPSSFFVYESDTGTTGAAPVRLTVPSDRAVTVDYATADGTALAGIDYVATSGRLVFPPGSTNQFVRVPILGDVLSEPPFKQFLVNYSNPTEALLAQTQAVWTIGNDDSLSVPSGFSASLFATGLTNPTRMAFAPDGRLFVCEQGGRIWTFRDGNRVPVPFLSLSNNVIAGSEAGLLGLAFDPGFGTNQFVYTYYSTTNGFVHNRVSRFTANGDTVTPGSELVIHDLDRPPGIGIHNAGDLQFGPDGKLYVSVGEHGYSTNSQTLSTRLGKLLRLNTDGSIPVDNPFYGTAIGPNRAIWAMGLRNPYAFAFQPGTGRLFINDVSDFGREEINEGVAGANYGWPLARGFSTNAAFSNPLLVYPAPTNTAGGCAITGGTFYDPPRAHFPAPYVGNYLFTDFCGARIWRLILTNGVTVTNFVTGINSAVDLKVGPDGSLYCLAYDYRDFFGIARGGRVFRIYVPGPPSQFESIRWLNSGAIELGISAEASRLYSLESSTDLITWQRLRNIVAPGSSFVIQEPSSQTGQRFYRLVE